MTKTKPTQLALIAAVARNGAIGKNNELVFKEPADLRHLRAATMGCPVVMGRKTWQSLPEKFRPLPGRRNIVVSHDPGFVAPGAEVATGLDAALRLVADAPKVFVLGGAQLYALALPLAHELVLTEVDADLPGDCFFPVWDRSQFNEVSRQPHHTEAGVAYSFVVYQRR
jgi:dihydrofolate reductase